MHRVEPMMTAFRRVLLHGSRDESFDDSVRFAGRLVDGFGAELHVVYTIDEPLSAGWTAETTPDKLPELHQAMEEEARERLGRVLGPAQDNIIIAIRTGRVGDELGRFNAEKHIHPAAVRGKEHHRAR